MRSTREAKILEYCQDKTVLHLGCVQHSIWEEVQKRGDWLHEKLVAVSNKVVGVDIMKEEVDRIAELYGYDIKVGDVENLDQVVSGKFDVVVCGELIEHVCNPGMMLQGIKNVLASESILLITTPNPWSYQRIRLIFKNIHEDKWLNREHVAWYSEQTLVQMLHRCGYQITELSAYDIIHDKISVRRVVREIVSKMIWSRLGKLKKYKYNYDGIFVAAKLSN